MSVCFAAAMSVTALVLTGVTWSKMSESLESVQRVMQTRIEWEKLLSLTKDAETGQRGFLLTGDESYLVPYEQARQDLPESVTKLAALAGMQKEGEKEVTEVNEMVREILELTSETVVVRRREGLAAALQLVGKNKTKVRMDELRRRVSRIIDEQQEFMNQRTRAMQMDMRWGYVSAISTGAMALLAGVVALFLLREAHHQTRREERLLMEKLRAEESNQQKSNFLATMSHEIRTPMNAILGFGELLEAEVESGKQRRYVQAILSGGRSLLQLINDILDLSKIEAGMMQVKEEPMDVRELGGFVQQLFAQQAVERGVGLKIEVAPALPHSLLLDGARLRQILINVVGNAFKFTRKGEVRVRFHTGSGVMRDDFRIDLHLEVADSGEGISEEFQKEIFKPFIQVGTARGASGQPGTGLGLTIVKRLTELIGGRVTLKSRLGEGTTFFFVFPGVHVSARLPVPQGGGEGVVDFDGLRPSRILVADDNETNRELLRGIFESSRHQVSFAVDGRQAVEAVLRERPDLVLMDIRMPGMDGRRALEEIRSHREFSLLPVIAVTASGLSADERQVRGSFDGFVRKPFSRRELFDELAQFIPKAERGAGNEMETGMNLGPKGEEEQRLWKDLTAKLRELEETVWPGVRDGMLMSEVKSFAEELREAALEAGCGPLRIYAEGLLDHVEAFSLSALEKALQGFPNCIKDIERHASEPSS